ncbi:hypothetical protein [Hydrogenivirga sp. 128-5-R1-1]|nr:hypothetical protein [Hydrogenivirga sp. 128-5-R1-1]
MNIGLPKGVKIFSSEETNLLRYIEDNISKLLRNGVMTDLFTGF